MLIVFSAYVFVLWWISGSQLSKNSLALPLLFTFCLLNFHLKRADHNFIISHFKSPNARMAEEYLFYLLLYAPLLIINQLWLSLAVLVVVSVLTAQIPRFRYSRNKHTPKFRLSFIPVSSYEWISGLRRSRWPFMILLVLSLTLSFLPAVSLFFCWILSIVVMQFYFPYEPAILISQQQKSA
ncbi:MAG: hypothetical protein K0S12_529, partial [Bacteroidetes bacterium]|nr:hypothetical protein [Bacteroidota bacterium]